METSRNVTYLRNAWYVAALSSEVSAEGLFARTLLNTPVLIYRTQNGSPGGHAGSLPPSFCAAQHGDAGGG